MNTAEKDDPEDICTDICYLQGDPSAPVTRGELNRTTRLISRVHLLPIRHALDDAKTEQDKMFVMLKSLDDAINDPKHGLESLRWWICRFAWALAAFGAGAMALLKFSKDMGWFF